MDKVLTNLRRAGEFFVFSIWLQSQMVDLIILRTHPEIVGDFIGNPSTIPLSMSLLRIDYWEKQFYAVKEEFKRIFLGHLSEQDLNDLESIYYLRNAIAHSHISMGRDYLLFRSGQGLRQEEEIKRVFSITPNEDANDPMVLKLSFFNDDQYYHFFNKVKRLDEECLERLSSEIGIPHSRIR